MNPHLRAVIIILLLGTVGIIAARFLLPLIEDQLQRETSDAADIRATLRIGVDNWIGYFPLCSRDMNNRMRQAGYRIQCEDDQADYPGRFARLGKKELELAVTTVDAYVLNGPKEDFPGVIIGVIDESKGGDALVARADRIPNLNALRQLGNKHIAFTPSSPSEHLLKSISSHFDLGLFNGQNRAWALPSDGAADALKKLLKGKADAAVVWEPEVSRALAEPGIIKLIGTEDTDKLIVDVLLIQRHYARNNPEIPSLLLKNWFATLRHYHEHPQQLREEIQDQTDLSPEQINAMLKGVHWATLTDNGLHWFGRGASGLDEEGLIAAINSTVEILRSNGDFDASPLPNGDPYRLMNSNPIKGLHQQQGGTTTANTNNSGDTLSRAFTPLSDKQWQDLQEVGNLKVAPVSFRRSAAILDHNGKLSLDQLAEKLRHYPNFRLLIKGHTGLKGDPQANLDLSADRAAAVARYLQVTYSLDANRIRALGFGASQPLPRLPGENDRAYGYRLPRVEVSLVTERY
jgi:outer membrane protein OmpA-like peptidoglycan-associated protein